MTLWTIPTGKSSITGQTCMYLAKEEYEKKPGWNEKRRKDPLGTCFLFFFFFSSPTLRIILTAPPAVLAVLSTVQLIPPLLFSLDSWVIHP